MIIAANFAFWGLFVVFGFIVVGYVAWMRYMNRKEKKD